MRQHLVVIHADAPVLTCMLQALLRDFIQRLRRGMIADISWQTPKVDMRPHVHQGLEYLIAVHAPRMVPFEVEHRIQQGRRTIEIDEADAHRFDPCVCLQRAHGLKDEFLKGLDEEPIMDARAVIVRVGVATDVVDDDVDRDESGTALSRLLCCADCRGEETAAHASSVSQRLKLRSYGAQTAADMAIWI